MAPVVAASSGSVYDCRTLPLPSGIAAGNLLIAVVTGWWAADQSTYYNTSAANMAAAWNAPAGWTFGTGRAFSAVASQMIAFAWYYRYADGSESGNLNFTQNPVNGAGDYNDDYGLGGTLRITGGPSSGNPFLETVYNGSTAAPTTITLPTLTPAANESLVLAIAHREGAGTLTQPASPAFTQTIYTTGGVVGGTQQVSYYAQATAAALNLTWTTTGASMADVQAVTIRGSTGSPFSSTGGIARAGAAAVLAGVLSLAGAFAAAGGQAAGGAASHIPGVWVGETLIAGAGPIAAGPAAAQPGALATAVGVTAGQACTGAATAPPGTFVGGAIIPHAAAGGQATTGAGRVSLGMPSSATAVAGGQVAVAAAAAPVGSFAAAASHDGGQVTTGAAAALPGTFAAGTVIPYTATGGQALATATPPPGALTAAATLTQGQARTSAATATRGAFAGGSALAGGQAAGVATMPIGVWAGGVIVPYAATGGQATGLATVQSGTLTGQHIGGQARTAAATAPIGTFEGDLQPVWRDIRIHTGPATRRTIHPGRTL